MTTSPRLFALVFALVVALAVPVTAGVPIIGPDGRVPSLAPLLKGVTPSVVNIAVMGKTSSDVEVAGSGVIVDAKAGYVLTNHHVIAHADRIVVTLKDDRKFDATLVGSDPDTDIAVLKIAAENLTALPLGDADRLEVGDYVLAIGNPFGLGQAVTSGIVSALGRTGLGPRELRELHPDRRLDQSWQFRRCAHQPAGRTDRHQHRHLHARRRQCRRRLCGADQYGARA